MKKILLTGGPCAGKTTLAQVILRTFEKSVVVVPEAASLLFNGGFPRWESPVESLRSTQRAIYHVQLELEAAFAARYPDKVLVCDRGTLDGATYWPDGPDSFLLAVGTDLKTELSRYDAVLYLESAAKQEYELFRDKNPNRRESWEEAQRLDALNYALWKQHPQFHSVHNQRAFGNKIHEVLSLLAKLISEST